MRSRLLRAIRLAGRRPAGRAAFTGACLLWLAVLACACLPPPPMAPTLAPTDTLAPTITPTETATIVWFPPTSTFTPYPTFAVTPTEVFQLDLGPLILEDDYTDQTAWPTMRTAAGSVAYGNQELTLAVAEPGGSLLSLRETPLVYDFYLEIDATPSLCRSGDTYGLLLRAASTRDFYRLLVSCDGQLRMERVGNGYVTPIEDWMISGQVLPGGMLRSRLGVWALKNEMRIFVNGVLQFSVRDPVWSSGQIGVFARSAGDTPLTVNFSNLTLYSLASGRPPLPTPTARPVTPTPPGTTSPTPAARP